MGFATIAAQIIFIGALLIFGSTLMTTITTSTEATHEAIIDIQKKEIQTEDETMAIISASHDTDNNLTTIEIKNTGKTNIKYEKLDIFVNQKRIPRLDANRTITIITSSQYKNPTLWDPEENIRIQVSHNLTEGTTNSIQVFTENAKQDIYSIQV